MHVGYGAVFQNPDNQNVRSRVWSNEIRLAEMAEPMGFDSVWASSIISTTTRCVPTWCSS